MVIAELCARSGFLRYQFMPISQGVNRLLLKKKLPPFQSLCQVEYRQVWLDTAVVLTRQGRLSTARSMLNEALLSAKAFNATDIMAKVRTYAAFVALVVVVVVVVVFLTSVRPSIRQASPASNSR